MVLDASALLAVLFGEPSADALIEAIAQAEQRTLSTASLLEASIVAYARKGADGLDNLDLLIERLHLSTHPFDDEQLTLARDGFVRFGKGRHPAALNFGDCFSYGLARRLAQPLLFVGNDFSQTDVLTVASP